MCESVPLPLPQYQLLRVAGINHVPSVFCWGLVCAKIPKQKLDTTGISSFKEKSVKWIEKNGNAEGKERRNTKWKSTWIRRLRNVKHEFIDCLTLEFFYSNSSSYSSSKLIKSSMSWASLVDQMVKRLPAMWETWVWSLGRKDPWRRKWQPTPIFSPRKFHRLRSLVGYSPRGCRVRHDWATSLSLSLSMSYYLTDYFLFFPPLFYLFINYYYYYFLPYNIVLVLPYVNMNPPWVYMCSPSWTPYPPPSL